MLHAFYGRQPRPRSKATPLHIRWVEQWRYLPAAAGNKSASTMLRWAPVYVPTSCAREKVDDCKVHVSYHGCTPRPLSSSMSGWYQRLLWLRNIQINEYAEANDIVVMYPQAAGSDDVGEGCFNWASYEDGAHPRRTPHSVSVVYSLRGLDRACLSLRLSGPRAWRADPLFDTRLGVQLNTVINMLNDLRGALNHSYSGEVTQVGEYAVPPFE